MRLRQERCPANRRSEAKGPYERVDFRNSSGRDAFAGSRKMRNSSSTDGDTTKVNGKRAAHPLFLTGIFFPFPSPSPCPFPSLFLSFCSARVFRRIVFLSGRPVFSSFAFFFFSLSLLSIDPHSCENFRSSESLRERMQNAMQTLIERNTRGGGGKPYGETPRSSSYTTGAAPAKFPSRHFFGNARSFARRLTQQLRNGKQPPDQAIENDR